MSPLIHCKLELSLLALHLVANLHQESLICDIDISAKGLLLAYIDFLLCLCLQVYHLNLAMCVQNVKPVTLLVTVLEDFHHGIWLLVRCILVAVDLDLF